MLFIKNAFIKTMAGPDIPNGCILTDDAGKIAAVGADLTPPDGAEVLDAGGRLVTPGCVEAHSHIGLHEEAMRWEGQDYNEKTNPIMPHMRAIDAFNPLDSALEEARRAGVTTACTGPGSSNPLGGFWMAVKMAGKCVDKMVIKDAVAMKTAFGENPKFDHGQSKGQSPRTRMGTAALLREALLKAQRYMEDKESGKNPAYDIKMEALIPLLKKEIPLKAHAHRADDIFTAIRIAREFDLKLTLDHCGDGHLIAEELAEAGYPAILGPYLWQKSKIETKNRTLAAPGILHKAGVLISITTDAPVVPIQYLPLSAGMAAAEGLPYEAAWKAITINPAQIMGIADRVGSLEAGKDADIVIWTADPLTVVGGRAYTTIIDGKVVWQQA